ncbi:MAG: hypothetical protein IJ404_07355 [Clostridia bacterium]|nr:hypothetical protein [Clostridia bacterium]
MAKIFTDIFNMSVAASWAILAVLVFRLIFKRSPKFIYCILWGIVGIRLTVPFFPSSKLSIIPSAATVTPSNQTPTPHFQSGVGALDSVVNEYIDIHYPSANGASTAQVTPTDIISYIWISVALLFILYAIIGYVRLKRRVSSAMLIKDNIFESERCSSPFVLGMISPKIYLPINMDEDKLNSVLLHERAHINRCDNIVKPIAFVILSFHWFNPLVWLSYVLLCKDIEMACDEKVIKYMTSSERADYSEALLSLSNVRKTLSVSPIAFGEVNVKARIKSVLSYKKPTLYIVIAALVALLTLSICLLTNPSSRSRSGNNIPTGTTLPSTTPPPITPPPTGSVEEDAPYFGVNTDYGYYRPPVKIEFPSIGENSEHKYYKHTYFETYKNSDDGLYYHRAFKECDHCGEKLEALTDYPCRYFDSNCKGGCLSEDRIYSKD